MKENTPGERGIIPARQASHCSKQEVPLNTYPLCLWGTQPLLQCSTDTPTSPILSSPPRSRTHLYCRITELMVSVLIQPPKLLFPLLTGKNAFWILLRKKKKKFSPKYASTFFKLYFKSPLINRTLPLIYRWPTTSLYSLISSYRKNFY